MNTVVTFRRRRRRTGFSLTEVLVAILILGIGVVSIASLLPVGISQQQTASDDILGPIVARNALSTIRSRVRAEQFGLGYRFVQIPDPASPTGFTTALDSTPWDARGFAIGDWGWLRPAFVPANAIPTLPNGGIDIFNQLELQGLIPPNGFSEQDVDAFLTDTGIPLNVDFPVTLPTAGVISQGERVYPQFSERPQYAWECMFRRRNGRVQVAVFVYRIVSDQVEGDPYTVALGAGGPPIPHRVDLQTGGGEPWRGRPWSAYDGAGLPMTVVPATNGPDNPFDFNNLDHHWQATGQQFVDQSGAVHRVIFGRERATDGPVELARPVQEIPLVAASPVFGAPNERDQRFLDPSVGRYVNGTNGFWDTRLVRELWYVPILDADGRQLVPVYVQVEEL